MVRVCQCYTHRIIVSRRQGCYAWSLKLTIQVSSVIIIMKAADYCKYVKLKGMCQ